MALLSNLCRSNPLPMNFNSTVFLLLIFFSSCSIQKRLFEAEEVAVVAKRATEQEKAQLARLKEKVTARLSQAEIDSSISSDFNEVLTVLNQNLSAAERKIAVLEEAMLNRSNFSGANYNDSLAHLVASLDSFNTLNKRRESIYQMVNEAITIKAFTLYKLAAFFEPGVYHIPAHASDVIARNFLPAIDSIAAISNKYAHIPRVVRLVFVGYADEASIEYNTPLYRNLLRFSGVEKPGRTELNRVLSELRAKEMERNMKMVVSDNASKFVLSEHLKFNYFSYGRGETFPSPHIKDYQKNDERRRIVMFYWSVLPDIGYLK